MLVDLTLPLRGRVAGYAPAAPEVEKCYSVTVYIMSCVLSPLGDGKESVVLCPRRAIGRFN